MQLPGGRLGLLRWGLHDPLDEFGRLLHEAFLAMFAAQIGIRAVVGDFDGLLHFAEGFVADDAHGEWVVCRGAAFAWVGERHAGSQKGEGEEEHQFAGFHGIGMVCLLVCIWHLGA
jgi:hypothetical protein